MDVIYNLGQEMDYYFCGQGRPEIQKFIGALQGQRIEEGIFIATFKFLREAEDYVLKN